MHYCDKARRQINRKGRAGWRLRNMGTTFQKVRLHTTTHLHVSLVPSKGSWCLSTWKGLKDYEMVSGPD